MPQITPYTEQLTAKGQLTSTATADTFGAGVGRAMQGVANSASNLAEVYGKMKQDEETLWAYKTSNDAYLQLRTSYEDEINKLNFDDPEFSAKLSALDGQFSSQLREKTSQLLSEAPSTHAAKQVEQQMLQNEFQLRGQVHQNVAMLRGQYSAKLLEDGTQKAEESLGSDATDANYNRVSANLNTTVDKLNGLGPEQKNKAKAQILGRLSARQGVMLASKQPKWFLSQIHQNGGALKEGEGGAYPQVAPMPEAEILASKPLNIAGWANLDDRQKIQLVRIAEGTLGGNVAQERGELTRAMSDYVAAARDGFPAKWDNRFNEGNLVRLYGQDEGRRNFEQLQHAQKVVDYSQQFATMPIDQAVELLKTLAPTDQLEYASKNANHNAATAALMNVQQQRAGDYIAWAKNTEGFKDRVQPLDFADFDKFRQSLGSRIALANSGVQDFKVPAHLMDKGEMEQFKSALDGMLPEQQMLWLKQVRQATLGHEDWFNDTVGQISKHSQMMAYAADMAARNGSVQLSLDNGNMNGQQVGAYILAGEAIRAGKEINGVSNKGFKIDDSKFRNLFYSIVTSNAFAGPDPRMNDAMRNGIYQAAQSYFAAYVTTHGLPPEPTQGLVKNAVEAVTGGIYKTNRGDTLFLPWGMPKETFQRHFPTAVNAAIEQAGLKGGEMDVPSKLNFANVGDGKYLVMYNNRPVQGKDNKNVIVDMGKYVPTPSKGGVMETLKTIYDKDRL